MNKQELREQLVRACVLSGKTHTDEGIDNELESRIMFAPPDAELKHIGHCVHGPIFYYGPSYNGDVEHPRTGAPP